MKEGEYSTCTVYTSVYFILVTNTHYLFYSKFIDPIAHQKCLYIFTFACGIN